MDLPRPLGWLLQNLRNASARLRRLPALRPGDICHVPPGSRVAGRQTNRVCADSAGVKFDKKFNSGDGVQRIRSEWMGLIKQRYLLNMSSKGKIHINSALTNRGFFAQMGDGFH